MGDKLMHATLGQTVVVMGKFISTQLDLSTKKHLLLH